MRMLGVLALVSALIAPRQVRAQESGGGGDPFNFNLGLEPQKPAVSQAQAERIERRVVWRRRALVAHQAFGFITLGLLAATLVVGTLNYVDKFGDGNYTEKYNLPHLVLAAGASGTFATGALLGLFAPNPYPKPIKADAALFHKLFMGFAAATFVAQLILGPISSSRAGQLDQRDLALSHLVVGYSSLAFMTAGTLAWVFK